jgi:hypothetical protein
MKPSEEKSFVMKFMTLALGVARAAYGASYWPGVAPKDCII